MLEQIAQDVKQLAIGNANFETRIRVVEDAVSKMSPYSGQLVQHDKRLTSLEKNQSAIFGGWKVVLWVSGALLGIASFVLTILKIFIFKG